MAGRTNRRATVLRHFHIHPSPCRTGTTTRLQFLTILKKKLFLPTKLGVETKVHDITLRITLMHNFAGMITRLDAYVGEIFKS